MPGMDRFLTCLYTATAFALSVVALILTGVGIVWVGLFMFALHAIWGFIYLFLIFILIVTTTLWATNYGS